jgi:hypothetical protein
MSASNPYAGKQHRRGGERAPVRVIDLEVPAGSVKQVLDWVGDDPDRATLAIQSENLRVPNQRRSTLISALSAIGG